MRFVRSLGWKAVLFAIAAVLFVGAGTGAAVCKFADVNCGLNPADSGPAPTSLDDFSDKGSGDMDLADGLTGSVVVSGLRGPTDFEFLPDGRILFTEKDGLVRMAENGRLARRPFLDLRSRVNTSFFRGVMNITVDPDFGRRPFIYVVYSVRGPGGVESREPLQMRVSRFEVRGDTAVAGSERIILGSERLPGKSCRALPRSADCIPADGDHLGADMVFRPDGTIFVSTGDGGGGDVEGIEPAAFLAQDPNTLGGKILHVDREGRGLPANPFWNGDPDANRSKVWATGLRNPFRITLLPGTSDTLVVGDVGWDSFEEIDIVERGSNHGWPCYEGPDRTPKYELRGFCRRYYTDGKSAGEPWFTMPQPPLFSITGGVPISDAAGWPAEFEGQYVFGDWLASEIYTVPLDVDSPAQESRTIASNAAGPVAFALRPDGLYFLAVNTGELRRIKPV